MVTAAWANVWNFPGKTWHLPWLQPSAFRAISVHCRRLEICIAGEKVSAGIAAAGVTARVTDASFGLLTTKTGGTVMEASGAFSLVGGDFASVSADLALFRYNTTTTAYPDGFQVGSGAHTFTSGKFTDSANLSELSVTNLNAKVAGYFSLSGDFGFRKNGGEMQVGSSGAQVAMTAGEYQVGVSNASLGPDRLHRRQGAGGKGGRVCPTGR
jgi:hypothetical protein